MHKCEEFMVLITSSFTVSSLDFIINGKKKVLIYHTKPEEKKKIHNEYIAKQAKWPEGKV